MILAYNLVAQDNGAFFFEKAPKSIFCPSCGCCLKDDYVPNELEFFKRNYDLSFTYANRCIVSERFKIFCENSQIQDVDFVLVDASKNIYFMKPLKQLAFDVRRRRTRFENYCRECKQYEEVIGASPVFLKNVEQEIGNGVYRTDIEFGTGKAKSPSIIVGTNTKRLIEKERFTGDPFFMAIKR